MRRIVIRSDKENTDNSEKLDLVMKTIKAFRANGGTADVNSLDSLEKQRHNQEMFSKLVTPNVTIDYQKDAVGDIPIMWAKPEFAHRKDKIILYCHGGGYTCGGLGYAGILAGKLAFHTGLEVFSFQYRLAPEHPYPAAIEDAVTIWNHLMYLGYGAKDVIIAGDSAGGNLALELTLILKEQKRMIPKALILMSPWTDMTVTGASYEKYQDLDPMLTKDYVLGVRRAYVGTDINVDFSNPSLSPLYADLGGMPPTFIQVGSNEILRSDSENLYKKLRKNDTLTKMVIYSGGWHVFQQMPTAKASKALEDAAEFITELI